MLEAGATEVRQLARQLEHECWADVAAQHAAAVVCAALDELAQVMAKRCTDSASRAEGILDERHRELVDAASSLHGIADRRDQVADLVFDAVPETANELISIGGKATKLVPHTSERALIGRRRL